MESTESSQPVVGGGKNTGRRSRWPVAAAVLAAVVFLGGTLYLINSHSLDEAKASALSPAQVQIVTDGFSPATVKVKKGQELTIVNNDSVSHSLQATSGLPAMGGNTALDNGESLTITPEESGTFTYHDTLGVTNFTGTIIVE